MVMRQPRSLENRRNLLAYFLECKQWVNYRDMIADNVAYWQLENLERAASMLAAKQYGMKGYTVLEWMLDVSNCIEQAKISKSTRARLITEMLQLYELHENAGTIEEYL